MTAHTEHDPEVRSMLVAAADKLFGDLVDAKLRADAKVAGWSGKLWRAVQDAEFHRLLLPEAAGGAGGSWSDAAAVLRIAARHTSPIPLAETWLAGWALAAAKLPVPDETLTLAPVRDERLTVRRAGSTWRLDGTATRVPFGRMAHRIVLLAAGDGGDVVICLERSQAEIVAGRNLAGEPRDTLRFARVGLSSGQMAPAPRELTSDALLLRGALLRAIQIGGALEAALALSVRYAQERVQFGRKIGQFQALQQELARAAGEVAAAVAAGLSAAGALDREGDAETAIASAKLRASQAAYEVSMIAHQVHGAIGITDEHPLHHATLRALAWRDEFGHENAWAARLGREVLSRGADGLWPMLTAH